MTGSAAASPPDTFALRPIITGLSLPTAFAYAPDGRIFIAEQPGIVRVFHRGVLRVFLDLRDEVNADMDRGLLGLALDPAFSRTRHVYLLYTEELRRDKPDEPYPARGRLIRINVSQSNPYVADAKSSVTLLSGFDAHGPSHSVGGLSFDSKGNLLVGLGDGHSYPNPPGIGPQALRALDLDSLSGKLLRIDPSSGDGILSNPYYDKDRPNAIRSKILAFGLRNPFRFSVDTATGDIYVGDVGTAAFEEINVVPATWSDPDRELNFGWPCYEGPSMQPAFADDPTCDARFYAREAKGELVVTHPLHTYEGKPAAAVIAGPVYHGRAYPAKYQERLFFADFPRDEFFTLANGDADDFGDAHGWNGPVDIDVTPRGTVAYLSLVDGRLNEIVYQGSSEDSPTVPRVARLLLASIALGLIAVGLFWFRRRTSS